MTEKTAKYMSIAGMIATTAWFFWNPKGWVFDWEPIVVFVSLLAAYMYADARSGLVYENVTPIAGERPIGYDDSFWSCLSKHRKTKRLFIDSGHDWEMLPPRHRSICIRCHNHAMRPQA